MDEEFLEINDLDWFAACRDGLLGHFATGGNGFVPTAVKKSMSVYEEVLDYFMSLEADADVQVIEENLPVFSNGVERDRYISPFVAMARRGLFSYDVNKIRGYDLIAKPLNIRSLLNLPLNIQAIVLVLPLRFSKRIDANDMLCLLSRYISSF